MMKGELPSALALEPVIPQDAIKEQFTRRQEEDTPRNGKTATEMAFLLLLLCAE
jgi:hypothetical protein